MRILIPILCVLSLYACARIVSPNGGPKDETAPVVLSSTPVSGTVNMSENKIYIEFDEYINNFSASDIIISPFQKTAPEVQIRGKTVVLEFKEELLDNITYNIDFNNKVVDYREKNPVENLSYVFSTGAEIDSASVSGKLIDSITGEPFTNEDVKVMLYENNDTLFFSEPPLYIAGVDSSGLFSIDYVSEGTYLVYALEDKNFNTFLDQTNEPLAFLSEPISTTDTTSQELLMRVHLQEEFFNTLDGPNVLKDGYGVLTLTKKYEELLFEDFDSTNVYIEQAPTKDSLMIWYNNGIPEEISLFANGETVDTIQFERIDQDSTVLNNFRFSASQEKIVDEPLKLGFKNPVTSIDENLFQIFVDSIEVEASYSFEKRDVFLEMTPNDTARYKLEIYPGAIQNFYGLTNPDTMIHRFKKPIIDSRGTLLIEFSQSDSQQYFIELFRNTKLSQTIILSPGINRLENLSKGDYELRITKDDIANGHWDTGDVYQNRQPERAVTIEAEIQIKPRWETEIVLDIDQLFEVE